MTADPFEVRLRFTSHLTHLTASLTSAQKTASYALKHREMDEDLHSCILEHLERCNLNARANIFYFFEALCDRARQEGHLEFIRMMERDILRIVDLVAPGGGPAGAAQGGHQQGTTVGRGGAANVKVVRRVLHSLQEKKYLQKETVAELEEFIRDRDDNGGADDDEAAVSATADAARDADGASSRRESGRGMEMQGRRLDKRQIEQRIEEDRERHKRLRESIWAQPVDEDGGVDGEFWRMVDEVSELGEDDYVTAAEEAEERRRCAVSHRLEVGGVA